MTPGPDSDLQELLQTLDPTSRVLMSEVVLGKDAEDFTRTDLGRSMVGMAKQDYFDAVLKLADAPWWRKGRIRELQHRAACSRMFLGYLGELIVRGRQASVALNEAERQSE